MRQISFLIVFLCITTTLPGQKNYELLYLNRDFDEIILQSEELSNADDFYWNALAQHRQGESVQAIQVLENGCS